MPTQDYIANLLGMEDVNIREIRENEREIQLSFRLQRMPQHCPACRAETDAVHDYRYRKLHALDLNGKRLTLFYERRRYLCRKCGKRFPEPCQFASRYQRFTHTVTGKIIELLHQRITLKQIAASTAASISSVQRILSRLSAPRPENLPTAISFDEFKGNADGEKFQCIITDPLAHKVLDILPSRSSGTLQSYLLKFSNRDDVRFVVMDMNRGFRDIARTFFPKATIIIDRFHVVRYCTQALDNVRRHFQKSLPADQRKYFKRSRRLLLTHRDKLSDEDRTAVDVMLRFSDKLTQAYALKEMFYHFMDAHNKNEANRRFLLWMEACDRLRLPEFHECYTMLKNWKLYILNAFEIPLSNGFTEGCNNAIKTLKRIAFGFRSFSSFRKRILLTANPYPYY